MNHYTKQVAKKFVERSEYLSMKGVKRENAALEFVCGAAAAVASVKGDDHADAKALNMMAYMVALRGYAELLRYANHTEAQQEQAALEAAAG